jgi:cell division septum initiation protein DivIVA
MSSASSTSASSTSAASAATLNIVELIEKNPITKLSQTYNNFLLEKIQENFSTFEQQLFVSSFYCYLNYDKNTDFIVDLDNVWKWLGFTQKITARMMIESNFKLNVDYTISIPEFKKTKTDQQSGGSDEEQPSESTVPAKPKNGGQNKQTIKLTIRCFKLLCLKAQTKKAGEIHDYYLRLEEIILMTVDEETKQLRAQLEQKNEVISTLNQATITLTQEKKRAIEKTLISQFPVNTECIYFGTIDNTNADNEKLIKFGHTNNLATRVADHHKKYTNFILAAAFRVHNKVEIENYIKDHPKIKRQLRTIEVAGKNKTEIIAYDSTNFTIERLTKHIEGIIQSRMYNVENFNRILQRNQELEAENAKLVTDLEQKNKAIHDLTLANNELREKTAQQSQALQVVATENESPFNQHILLPDNELTQKFDEFVATCCIVRPDVEEESVNLEGRFRLWSHTKPAKETFHALKHYMDVKFKPKRIDRIHGYQGIKLKTVDYKKVIATEAENPAQFSVETFIFQCCQFSDRGKILNSTLLKEYQQWKISVGQTPGETDLKNLKTYLNACPNALKSTIWFETTANEGYYGLGLRQSYTEMKQSIIQEQGANPIIGVQLSTTGKKVEKRLVSSNQVLKTWNTIAKAATDEGFSTAKMSRSVKDKTVFKDYYYCVAESV